MIVIFEAAATTGRQPSSPADFLKLQSPRIVVPLREKSLRVVQLNVFFMLAKFLSEPLAQRRAISS